MDCVVSYGRRNDAKQQRTYFVSDIRLGGAKRTSENVIALIGDYCITIQCIANKLGKPLIGFESH